MPKIIKSSSILKLGEKLKNHLKSRGDAFTTPFLVMKNQNVEKWFKTFWIESENDILMNISFIRMDDLIIKTAKDAYYDILSGNEITTRIMALESKKGTQPYILDGGKINPVKLRDFAKEMNYAFNLKDAWGIDFTGEDDDKKWKNELYNEVMDGKITIKNIVEWDFENINRPIHIFVNFILDKIYLEFIKKLIDSGNEVYIYTLCSDEEDKIGKDSLKLFDEQTNKLEKLGEVEYLDNNHILNKEHTFVFSAPSRVKEIQVVHSEICNILHENSNASYRDFLVVAPNMGDYVDAISQVFRQDPIKYPNIPFVIKTSSSKDSTLGEALDILLDVYVKGYYTRKDLYLLMGNRLVQFTRKITDEDVDAMMEAIIATNVYRKKEKSNDFDILAKRLLISKLIDDNDEIKLGDDTYIPYSSMDIDDALLSKLIDVINDLDELVGLKAKSDGFDKIKDNLDKWFAVIDYSGNETNNLYRKVINVYNILKNEDLKDIELFFIYAKDVTMVTKSTGGEIFTNGITFVDMVDGNILPAKYVFIIGFNSFAIPRKKDPSEFYTLEGMPSNTEIDKGSFYTQVLNAGDELFISYLSLNQKTDEKYYSSILLDEIKEGKKVEFSLKETEEDGKKVIELFVKDYPIDEDRPYKELYTQREIKNHEYYLNLRKSDSSDSKVSTGTSATVTISSGYTPNKTISLSNIKSFLEEPLMEKITRLMKTEEDISSDALKEYEPLDYDALEKYNYIKEIVKRSFNDETKDIEEIGEEYKKELLLVNNIIFDNYKELMFDEIIKSAKKLKTSLVELIPEGTPLKGLVRNITDVRIPSGSSEWFITSNALELVYVDEKGKKVIFGALKEKDDEPGNKDFLEPYVFSLMYFASLDNDDTFTVSLNSCGGEKVITLNKNKAIELLNKIYDKYNDYNENYAIPIDKLEETSKVNTLADLHYQLMHGNWKYAQDSDLISMSGLGYTEDDFLKKGTRSKWEEVCKEQRDLIIYIEEV